MNRLRLGTRGSALARRQTELAAEALGQRHPDLSIEMVTIRTGGDRSAPADQRPEATGGEEGMKGLFTREIEEKLLAGEIDMAVHSFKDLPLEETPGLEVVATPARADPRDVLVSRAGGLAALPWGARVGTGSLRRELLLREARPDVTVLPVRGNVDTRLRRMAEGAVDALVLAGAGLLRLGRAEVITEWLPPERFVPAPGQGALALQARREDVATVALLTSLDHAPTHAAVRAERRFAAQVGGGCRLPVGAYAAVERGRMRLTGLVAGAPPVRVSVEGGAEEGERLADEAARAALAGVGA